MIDHAARCAGVQTKLAKPGIDALLVTSLTNVEYLCGFSGTNGQLLVTADSVTFFTDPRYEARAASLVSAAEISIYRARLTDELGRMLGSRSLGIEAAAMTVAEKSDLEKQLGIETIATKDIVEALRRVKDADELAMMREAVRLADDAFEMITSRLTVGMSEREVGLEIELHMRRAGADGVSFDPIVGSGDLSAHIHHTPSDRTLEKGDLVLLDLGARWSGYCSDLTRTVVLGSAADEQREIYNTVLKAQSDAIAAIAPGVTGIDVDRAARKVIEDAGYGDTFGHGTGHGVGLDIHEAPRLHYTSEDVLVEHDVVTVEPGVYLQGRGGVRIEDCVLVTADGAEVLGKSPKDELIEIEVNG